MKQIAILVIAATDYPLYVHYLNHYWSDLIAYTNAHTPHIRVFLLFEHRVDLRAYKHLRDNILQDTTVDLDSLCDPAFHRPQIPGTLSKTLYAFELLQDKYDVFFRTNLSSLIRLPQFDAFVQNKDRIVYSGAGVWADALRQDLLAHNRIGPDNSIKSLAELDRYEGNTFISGSGYFLSAAEVQTLVRNKHRLRYDIVDDVSIGLMMSAHEILPDFSLTVPAHLSIPEAVRAIRNSTASHIRLEHFPLEHAQAFWKEIQNGELWKAAPDSNHADLRYQIYFPLFDDIEARSNEVRLTHAGLTAHPRVVLVNDPDAADYLIFCQNHLVSHCPFHTQFQPLKDRLKHRAIMLDYGDDPHLVYDADDFRWALYFKRSCVERLTNQAIDYAGLPILPTAYGVADDMIDAPDGSGSTRHIVVSCLFEDAVIDSPVFSRARGRLLQFAQRLARDHALPMQIGPVSECGPIGRSGRDPNYKECLFDSKIVLHANPDWWEGDSRLWEAVASGALVFVDRMCQPIPHPLVDGVHVIFYDLTDDGMKELERRILYYLSHDDERETIGRQGREFAVAHHRPINRVNGILEALDRRTAHGSVTDEVAHKRSVTATQSINPVREVAEGSARRHADSALNQETADLPDIIVTIATGYTEVDEYRPFISSLRRTGATCPVFIGITDGPEYESVRTYLLDNAVNYFPVPPITPGHKVVNGYRFEQYRQWLDGIPFRYALIIDLRDAYFQRDPFLRADDFMHDSDLYLMSEFRFLTIGNHPNGMNYAWVRDAFGTPAADAIADEVILNSGAILGRKTAVLQLVNEIARVTSRQNYAFADQGTLNYLAHTGRLNHCGRIRIARAGLSLVNNCGFTEIDLLRQTRPMSAAEEEAIAFIPRDASGRLKLCRDAEGWVLDDDGTVSHVVHQYDRCLPEMDEFVSCLANYQHPDDVFVHGGNRQYRGEKFILFSPFGIDPSALRMLIRKIKGVSVGTKPLLIVNRHFKHSFVFAYGVLHNDLLFESDTFRRHFSEETATEEKCDAFCQRWGYRPIFVEEEEILRTRSVWVNPVILRLPGPSDHPLRLDGTTLVPGRECGGCTACCVVMRIDEPDIQKLTSSACRHCVGGGCAIYAARPPVCRSFYCAWRTSDIFDEDWRPDKSGVLACVVTEGIPDSFDRSTGIELTLVDNPLRTVRQRWFQDFVVTGFVNSIPLFLSVAGPRGRQVARVLLNTEEMRAAITRRTVSDALEAVLQRLHGIDLGPTILTHTGNDVST